MKLRNKAHLILKKIISFSQASLYFNPNSRLPFEDFFSQHTIHPATEPYLRKIPPGANILVLYNAKKTEMVDGKKMRKQRTNYCKFLCCQNGILAVENIRRNLGYELKKQDSYKTKRFPLEDLVTFVIINLDKSIEKQEASKLLKKAAKKEGLTIQVEEPTGESGQTARANHQTQSSGPQADTQQRAQTDAEIFLPMNAEPHTLIEPAVVKAQPRVLARRTGVNNLRIGELGNLEHTRSIPVRWTPSPDEIINLISDDEDSDKQVPTSNHVQPVYFLPAKQVVKKPVMPPPVFKPIRPVSRKRPLTIERASNGLYMVKTEVTFADNKTTGNGTTGTHYYLYSNRGEITATCESLPSTIRTSEIRIHNHDIKAITKGWQFFSIAKSPRTNIDKKLTKQDISDYKLKNQNPWVTFQLRSKTFVKKLSVISDIATEPTNGKAFVRVHLNSAMSTTIPLDRLRVLEEMKSVGEVQDLLQAQGNIICKFKYNNDLLFFNSGIHALAHFEKQLTAIPERIRIETEYPEYLKKLSNQHHVKFDIDIKNETAVLHCSDPVMKKFNGPFTSEKFMRLLQLSKQRNINIKFEDVRPKKANGKRRLPTPQNPGIAPTKASRVPQVSTLET